MQAKKWPFYVINYICLQAKGMWKLAYINGKESLVLIFKVPTFKIY